MLDTGQIMEDLIPISRPEGDVSVGDARYQIPDMGYEIRDTRTEYRASGTKLQFLCMEYLYVTLNNQGVKR